MAPPKNIFPPKEFISRGLSRARIASFRIAWLQRLVLCMFGFGCRFGWLFFYQNAETALKRSTKLSHFLMVYAVRFRKN